jgi:hypothetical protein
VTSCHEGEMSRLCGVVEGGASPAATLLEAKRFLGRCGVLEGVLRRVAWNEERERSWTQQ